MNSGYEFLGSVIGAGILGFAIDQYFDTTPWAMMILLVVGFVGATIKAQRAMNKDSKTAENSDESKKD
ncbi:MAG: AtpZ/AtpI family protein [Alphaproteobacteria bacterium]|nr:AtpZ/AtpI family protein [Alphaproteobacteria bacterium]